MSASSEGKNTPKKVHRPIFILKLLMSHKSCVTKYKERPWLQVSLLLCSCLGLAQVLTYFSRNILATETKACCDIEAVHWLQTIMALRSCDIDRYRQENGDIHGNDRPGSGDQHRNRIEWPFKGKFSAKGQKANLVKSTMFWGGLNVWLIPSWQMTRIEYFYYAAELCFRNVPVHCEQKLSALATPAPGYCYQYSWLRETSARIRASWTP